MSCQTLSFSGYRLSSALFCDSNNQISSFMLQQNTMDGSSDDNPWWSGSIRTPESATSTTAKWQRASISPGTQQADLQLTTTFVTCLKHSELYDAEDLIKLFNCEITNRTSQSHLKFVYILNA
jgi:hypothetical protein